MWFSQTLVVPLLSYHPCAASRVAPHAGEFDVVIKDNDSLGSDGFDGLAYVTLTVTQVATMTRIMTVHSCRASHHQMCSRSESIEAFSTRECRPSMPARAKPHRR